MYLHKKFGATRSISYNNIFGRGNIDVIKFNYLQHNANTKLDSSRTKSLRRVKRSIIYMINSSLECTHKKLRRKIVFYVGMDCIN